MLGVEFVPHARRLDISEIERINNESFITF